MSTLTYNQAESISKYIRKAIKFNMRLNQEKYNIILNFINDILNLYDPSEKYKSLLEIKLINFPDNNTDIINQYSNLFKIKFGLKLDPKKYNLIAILKNILKNIDYYLTEKIIKNKNYYTIKQTKIY